MLLSECQGLKKYLEKRIDECERINGKWSERFAQNPHDALDWSQDVFEAAAKLRVLHQIKLAVDFQSKATLDSLIVYIQNAVNLNARSPTRSTAAASNLLQQCELSAYATYLEEISARVERWEKENNS